MTPKLNFHYTIYYKPLYHFDFVKYNEIVDETEYAERTDPYIPKVIQHLKDRPNSRQEVITTHNNSNDACLISLQFLVVNNRLVVIANFRSQCRINGRPYDSMMLRYIATLISRALSLNSFIIYCNVAQYHENKGALNNFGLL